MARNPGALWTSRIRKALSRSRENMAASLEKVLARSRLDEEDWEQLEELLVTADIGIETAATIVNETKRRARKDNLREAKQLRQALAESIAAVLRTAKSQNSSLIQDKTLVVYILVGVNGSGKTTTAGKLAARFSKSNSVVIAAADTFRAAAVEQLSVWAKRSGADLVRHQRGGDSAAVAFDAVRAAKARGADILIVDTAGRLHTKTPLMIELQKIKKVIARETKDASVQTLLVIDATTGQNGLNQTKAFIKGIGIDGLVLTKLDGTAKGGIAIGVAEALSVPVLFAGIGEGPEDLIDFDPDEFARALVGGE